TDRGCDCDRRGVGPTAAERGDASSLRVDALKTGDDRDLLAVLEAVHQLTAIDVQNSRRGMCIAGLDRYLPSLPGARLNAHGLQRDREQTGSDLLAGSHHGVILAGVMQRRCFAAPLYQFVGLASHRGNHHRNVVTGVDLPLHMARDIAYAFDVADGCTAEFHHKAAHDDARWSLQRG